ncbi:MULTISPECIES: hypothetical protein [Microbacterium]|uniref:Uncharacterized protein n=1 Tax=Microbacterium wangchenii TaxID=2541726 RepID=A0ABX5SV82_9MICO|nr:MULTISPECIES: hypothetical protein [Microbacterium]MCK6067962.1 hypothetical protein [Microbacterium sp. EYE_512]QBR89157.1 hypothetical protein E4K62_10955 [Microbacterium wangchenii]TXK10826.1 hypothetical protein FVP99_16025 [Microbacterium wangchenii]
MDDARPNAAEVRSKRGPEAALAIVIGGVLALTFGWSALGLVRDTLHFNCSWGIGGEWGPDGTWVCADGIGYLGVAVVLGGMSALIIVAGLLVAIAAPSRGRSVMFLVLAAVPIGWIGWWTYYAATLYSGPRPAGETGLGLWAATVLPSIILCTVSLIVGAARPLMMRRWSFVALWCGVGLMLIATVLQLGIGIATFVSAGMLAAAGVGRAPAR